jgi:hypothetical protein
MLTQNKDHTSKTLQNCANGIVRSNPLFDLLRLALRPQSVPPDSPTTVWIKKNPILAVVGLAYALSWIGLIPAIHDPGIPLRADLGHISDPSVLIYVFIGVLGLHAKSVLLILCS